MAIKKAEIEKTTTYSKEEIFDYIIDHKDIRNFERVEQKTILANFIDKIKLSDDGINITLKTIVDPSTSDNLDPNNSSLDRDGGAGEDKDVSKQNNLINITTNVNNNMIIIISFNNAA